MSERSKNLLELGMCELGEPIEGIVNDVVERLQWHYNHIKEIAELDIEGDPDDEEGHEDLVFANEKLAEIKKFKEKHSLK